MEMRRDGVGKPPLWQCRDYPSFSSTLLDAIYRSIDEADMGGAAMEKCPSGALDSASSRKKNVAGVSEKRRATPSIIYPVVNQPRREHSGRYRYTSSSSDGSSSGSFSSSDHESVFPAHPARLRPIRTTLPARSAVGPDPLISSRIPGSGEEKKERRSSIQSRLRNLTNGSSPASPGARLANFLNSLFATKAKVSSVSACATNSSSPHSCLRKTPESGKRTVRFFPVNVIIGDDCHPCGEKRVYGGDRPPAARPPAVEEHDDDRWSDSSSDLFELKNLAVIGRLREELPVHGTARPGKYTGISRGGLAKKPLKESGKGL